MIRNSGYRFSLRQTQRVCAEIMLKQETRAGRHFEERPSRDALAYAIEIVSLSMDEQRNAVYRSLYDRPQDQALLRLWADAAGDRALAQDGQRRAPGSDGAVARAHGGSGPRTDGGAADARLMMRTREAVS